MMTHAVYIAALEKAKPMKAQAIKLAHDLMAQHNLQFYQTSHFIQRFAQRASSPIEAVECFKMAVRSLNNQIENIRGKKAAIKVRSHVFIFDCTSVTTMRAITCWVTDLPDAQALAGRADVLISFQ